MELQLQQREEEEGFCFYDSLALMQSGQTGIYRQPIKPKALVREIYWAIRRTGVCPKDFSSPEVWRREDAYYAIPKILELWAFENGAMP